MSKADHTRTFIIERTAPVFNRKGYAGTSLADMTEATGLTKGCIYGNFENKDEVALAAFDHNLGQILAMVTLNMSKEKTATGKLMAVAKVYRHFNKRPFPEGGCPILNTGTEADDTHPALRKKAAAAIDSWKKTIEAAISEGIRKKEFRAEIKVAETALTLIATLEGGILIARLTKKNEYQQSILQSIEQMILALRR